MQPKLSPQLPSELRERLPDEVLAEGGVGAALEAAVNTPPETAAELLAALETSDSPWSGSNVVNVWFSSSVN